MTKKQLKDRLQEMTNTEASLMADVHFVHGQMQLLQELLGMGAQPEPPADALKTE